MELKKTRKSNLENKRSLFFQIGLVITLGAVLMAFMGTRSVKPVATFGESISVAEEDYLPPIPLTTQPEKRLLLPPKPIEVINLIPDDVNIDAPFDFSFDEPGDEYLVDVPMIKPEIDDNQSIDSTFVRVEDMPEFPGGELSLLRWLASHVVYPSEALRNEIQGKVYVAFVVNKTGKVTDAKTARSVDPLLDNEALRVVNAMPKWKPGMQRKIPVNVSYTVPINFQIQ